jgi:hypothetical protein
MYELVPAGNMTPVRLPDFTTWHELLLHMLLGEVLYFSIESGTKY